MKVEIVHFDRALYREFSTIARAYMHALINDREGLYFVNDGKSINRYTRDEFLQRWHLG